ncbi:MAG: TetR/AcrR family transcriptional regulator [Lactobacillus sp.]|nr:TetR/AcrR family transcriptional regulator [Lactobacillus sp.]
MARKKEIGREKILDAAYNLALKVGLNDLTARSIAAEGDFSTQPIYLEFTNLDELRQAVLDRFVNYLTSDRKYEFDTGNALIDLCMDYIHFCVNHTEFFSSIFVYGKQDTSNVADQMIDIGVKLFYKQYPNTNLTRYEVTKIVAAFWTAVTGVILSMTTQQAMFGFEQIQDMLEQSLKNNIEARGKVLIGENPLFNKSFERKFREYADD